MRLAPLLLGESDDASALRGHFGLHRRRGDAHELIRDPLGVHQLFFAIDGEEVHSATYLADLRREGFEVSRIWSVPSGHRVTIAPRERRLELDRLHEVRIGDGPEDDEALSMHARRIARSLDDTFHALSAALEGERVFVTLSGGLDSTGIAVLAKEHLPHVTAVTFAMDGDSGASSDLASARKVAEALGIELIEVVVRPEHLLELIDSVLVWGQDWRDFNVHCGLVNAALAEALPEGATVLTGDGMNELMADYAPVRVGPHTLYALPRLPPGRLRRFLIHGLDSGDREVGVFARRGIRTVQPYLLCADAYAALPDAFVSAPESKQALVARVLGDRVPRFVYERPKVRAQVGSSAEVGGTVRLLLDRGWDGTRLAARFRELLSMSEREQRSLVRAGFYRFPTRWPEGTTS